MEIKNRIRTIIGKNSLVLIGRGEKELASQVFHYEKIREIRADLEKFEVKLLMDYDSDYFKVFSVIKTANDKNEEEAKKELMKFYDFLVTKAASFTEEEIQSIRKGASAPAKKAKK